MSDPYRRLLLEAVEAVTSPPSQPGRTSLIALLRIATPSLTEADIDDPARRDRLWRELLRRIHPDKHPGDAPRATMVAQGAAEFYGRCLQTLPTGSPAPPPAANPAGGAGWGGPSPTYGYVSSTGAHRELYRSTHADALLPMYLPSVSWSCCCHHLTNLLALAMVLAFLGFAAYVVLHELDG
jgi:hypothetical protein